MMKSLFLIYSNVSRVWEHLTVKVRYYNDFFKSIVFNYVYLPPAQARKLPIWVHKLNFAKWARYKGKIIIDCDNIYPKMIRMGVIHNTWYPDCGINLHIDGTLKFKGKCIVGNDSSIYVKEGSTLEIGNDVLFAASCRILCENSVKIGDNTRFGWNVLIMDTNFHYMKSSVDGTTNMNISSPIVIGHNNWFGNGVSISKGFHSADYVTVGAGTKCRGLIEKNYTIWANDGRLHQIGENYYRDLSKDPDLFTTLF